MPARVVKDRLLKELKTKSDREKIQLLKETLAELPGYTSGPYGKLRNWINEQLETAKTRSGVTHQETFAVRKEGDAQIALVGAPNSGKSALLHALTGRHVTVGNYPFTTLRPIAATLNVDGALLQLVEIPGLIEGASAGKGNGRAMLSVARVADACVYVAELSQDGLDQLAVIEAELLASDLTTPRILIATKSDLADAAEALAAARSRFGELTIAPVSARRGQGLDEVRRQLWSVSGLIRVFPAPGVSRENVTNEAIVLRRGSTVTDFAGHIHKEVAHKLRQARVWGPSSRFDGQLVRFDHVLLDGDRVELKT